MVTSSRREPATSTRSAASSALRISGGVPRGGAPGRGCSFGKTSCAERRVDPCVERLGEGDQLLPRAAGPLTGYNYGATSLFQKAGDVLDLLRVGSRPGGGRRVRARGAGISLGEDVGRQGEHHRTGAAGGGDAQAPLDELRHPIGAVDRGRPLADRGVESRQVHLLKRFPAQKCVSTCPSKTTMGVESCIAVCTPIAGFEAPTPRVAIATAGTPVSSLASASAINEAPDSCLVETSEKSGMLFHGVHDLEEALAGDGVEAPDACPRTSTSTATEPAPLVEPTLIGLSPMIFAPHILHSRLQDGLYYEGAREGAGG